MSADHKRQGSCREHVSARAALPRPCVLRQVSKERHTRLPSGARLAIGELSGCSHNRFRVD
jgi:hypothetical protein